jgi:hypothetical protein
MLGPGICKLGDARRRELPDAKTLGCPPNQPWSEYVHLGIEPSGQARRHQGAGC